MSNEVKMSIYHVCVPFGSSLVVSFAAPAGLDEDDAIDLGVEIAQESFGQPVVVPIRPQQVGRWGHTPHGVLEGADADSGGDYGTVRFLDGNTERWSVKSVLVVGRLAETLRTR